MLNSKGDNNYLPFQETNKSINNNDPLEMCKNIISALILIYQPIRILSHGVVKQEVEALHRSYLNIF